MNALELVSTTYNFELKDDQKLTDFINNVYHFSQLRFNTYLFRNPLKTIWNDKNTV